jgi:hypothetical protein
VNLEGINVHLVEGADEIRYLDLKGACACAEPGAIRLGPASFTSEEQLAATLAHEHAHVLQFAAGIVNSADIPLLEEAARTAEGPAVARLLGWAF